jgi:hypothetical protein
MFPCWAAAPLAGVSKMMPRERYVGGKKFHGSVESYLSLPFPGLFFKGFPF